MSSPSSRLPATGRRLEAAVTAVVVAAVIAFVFVNLRPWLWVLETTPTGGDLGAHVWAPAYLRDVLLGELRFTGWSHDWYAGFPAFTFYMVLPSLLVVIVEAGIGLPANLYAHAAAAAGSAVLGVRLAAARAAGDQNPDGGIEGSKAGARPPAPWSWKGAGAGAAVALVAMQVLDRLDGRDLAIRSLGVVRYNDAAVDLFLAVVILPAAVGWLAWTALSARPAAAGSPAPAADSGSPAPAAGSAAAGSRLAAAVRSQRRRWGGLCLSDFRLPLTAAAVAAAAAMSGAPYGVALKVVAVLGVLALPVAAYGTARLGGVAFPGPALAAVATVPFLFDRSFNIYGGNLMSTMAGEFAYSLGLVGAVVYIGVAARGMPSGRHRVLAGVLLAVTGLTHLFSAFLALVATGALFAVLPWRREAVWARLRWTAVTGALGAALSAWWVLPFWWNRGYLNDMGWGKERRFVSALWSRSEFDYDFLANDPPLQPFVVLAVLGAVVFLIRRARFQLALAVTAALFAAAFLALPEGRLWNVRLLPFYYWAVYLTALLGLGEMARTAVAAVSSLRARRAQRRQVQRNPAQRKSAQQESAKGKSVWRKSVRLLQVPAGAEAGETEGAAGEEADPARTAGLAGPAVGGAVALAAAAVVLVAMGLPLRSLPWGSVNAANEYAWGPFRTSELNLGPYWVQYNFEGYERKQPTDAGGGASEYEHLVNTMARVGREHGCGVSLWEFESGRLGSYGTPMAPMLLPHWTDGCIGSMEGLYFEASATTPYHFMMQSELSASPSRAQRDLPYSGFDAALGVQHLRLMGVRYYLAFTLEALRQARAEPGFEEIEASGPWVVFSVADSAPVVGLSELPVVVEDMPPASDGWLEVSAGVFLMGEEAPLLARDGPADWPRMTLASLSDELGTSPPAEPSEYEPFDVSRVTRMRRLAKVLEYAAPRRAVDGPAEVSDFVRGDHSISFSVDRVGAPVLVRTSYFPNWSASGARGPYRVTPNLMVVVPTETEVTLRYGRSGVEWFSALVTLAGLAAAGWLAWRSRPSSAPGR